MPARRPSREEMELRKMELELEGMHRARSKQELELEGMSRSQRKQELELRRMELEQADWEASADFHRVYTFIGGVNQDKVAEAIDTLERWGRRDPRQPITVVFNSPGGSVIDGLALYDTLLDLRRRGHRVTTVARGEAASMGGVLLQAGDERVIGRNGHLLIHQVSWGAHGSSGRHEDMREFSRKLEDRLLQILAERSSLSVAEIRTRWERRDWWLGARQAVRLGFADRLG